MKLKKVLIINNESARDDMGYIPAGVLPTINKEISHISNLIDQVAKLPNVVVETMYFEDVATEAVDSISPDCIISSGRVKDWVFEEIAEKYASELDFIRTTRYPFLGICAGHQLIALAFGAKIGKIVEGEDHAKELGYLPIEVENCDTLFRNLSFQIICMEIHRDEIKEVPEGFKLIASTKMCRRKGICHISRPIYGVQFHPEFYSEIYPDGKILMENFIGIR